MKFQPEDYIKVVKLLELDANELDNVRNKLSQLETKSAGLVKLAVNAIAELEGIDANVTQELGTNQATLTKAGSLEWGANRFIPILQLKKQKMLKLGNILEINPNIKFIDDLLQTYGFGIKPTSGRLIRN